MFGLDLGTCGWKVLMDVRKSNYFLFIILCGTCIFPNITLCLHSRIFPGLYVMLSVFSRKLCSLTFGKLLVSCRGILIIHAILLKNRPSCVASVWILSYFWMVVENLKYNGVTGKYSGPVKGLSGIKCCLWLFIQLF